MERGITLIDFVNVDSMVQVHGNSSTFSMFLRQPPHVVSTDYEGVGLGSRDANSKAAAGQASKIFQDYYPELLVRILDSPCMGPTLTPSQSKKFFINVPTFMTWVFWLFKPLISANTLAKMSVVGSGTATISEALLPVIDIKELPKRYGGEAEAF